MCWMPIRIYRVYTFYLQTTDEAKSELEDSITEKITKTLYYIVSAIMNPILYNFMSTKFRKAFMKAFGCRKQETNSQSTIIVPITTDILQDECNNNETNTKTRQLRNRIILYCKQIYLALFFFL